MSTSSISPARTQGRAASPASPRQSRGRDRRGVALALVLGAQLMIILDMTVVNIALPSIARGLHFSAPSLSWVLNAYTLTFGGLLLLGGRAGDILGRRRVFIAGIALFTAASLAGGLATSAPWLLAARAAQGVGGAIASPAVLALITASFAEGRERTRAIGIYTAVAMGGGSLGLVLGGVITQWVSWRWVLFINVPIGIAVLIAAPLFLGESQRQPGRFDVAGALSSTAGMTALVYGFIRAASDGWVRGERVTRPPADHPAAAVCRPQPVRLPGGPVADRGRHVRDVLLPHPVRPGHPGVQPAAGRYLLPADDRHAVRRITAVAAAARPVQPQGPDGGRDAAGGARDDLAVPDLARHRLPGRGPRPDADARCRDGRGLRAADDGIALRRPAGRSGWRSWSPRTARQAGPLAAISSRTWLRWPWPTRRSCTAWPARLPWRPSSTCAPCW